LKVRCGLRNFAVRKLREAWALNGGLDRMAFSDWVRMLDKTILAMLLNQFVYEYYEEKERKRLLKEEGIEEF